MSKVRVLAFCCSRHRPMMLRHAVMQMAMQTYPVDFAVYINSDQYPSDQRDYSDLLRDIPSDDKCRVMVSYGPSLDQHQNHLKALEQIDVEDYDVFLKIDDDDVYRLDYVASIVNDFAREGWDFSGEHASGTINGANWWPDREQSNMGLGDSEDCLGIAATWAFSRHAIKAIQALDSHPQWFEDRLWKTTIEPGADIKTRHRANSGNYQVHIHGANTSTAGWLESDTEPQFQTSQEELDENQSEAQPLALTPVEAVKIALKLLKEAAPQLPRVVVYKLRATLKRLFRR